MNPLSRRRQQRSIKPEADLRRREALMVSLAVRKQRHKAERERATAVADAINDTTSAIRRKIAEGKANEV